MKTKKKKLQRTEKKMYKQWTNVMESGAPFQSQKTMCKTYSELHYKFISL